LTPYLDNLGSSLSELGRYAGALDCFRRSLALTEKQLGPEHPLLLLPLTGLGEAYLGLGDHEHAIDQLGALYRGYRATAARWVADVRARLRKAVPRQLMARPRLDEAELESVMRLARSQLDVSVRRLLQPKKGKGADSGDK
jgi:tetratricopeptide (TPR) repeat protein